MQLCRENICKKRTILENTVRGAKRAIIGQFTTPPILADILTRLTITNKRANCIDPCCGTGTIPKSILKFKSDSIGIKDAYKTTWASDKYPFPLQISNISMTNKNAINISNILFKSDVFDLKENKSINIINPANGNKITLQLPKSEAVASNLPFIPFELFGDDELNNISKIIQKI